LRWRIHRPNSGSVVGELMVVTIGVLIALAIDQWNDERETDYPALVSTTVGARGLKSP
jgi:hypothetical protein